MISQLQFQLYGLKQIAKTLENLARTQNK